MTFEHIYRNSRDMMAHHVRNSSELRFQQMGRMVDAISAVADELDELAQDERPPAVERREDTKPRAPAQESEPPKPATFMGAQAARVTRDMTHLAEPPAAPQAPPVAEAVFEPEVAERRVEPKEEADSFVPQAGCQSSASDRGRQGAIEHLSGQWRWQ
jgi:hypothetical protein